MSTKLISFLIEILGDYKEYPSRKEFYFECPFCKRGDGVKKFAIRLDQNGVNKRGESSFTSYHCWRDISHTGANLITLARKLNLSNDKINEARSILKELKFDIKNFESIESKLERQLFGQQKVETRKVDLPKEFKSFLTANKNDVDYKNAFNYISSRNITVGDIIKNNIGYCDSGKYAGFIILPSYDKDGNVNYFIGRNYYSDVYNKHKNCDGNHNIVFNELHINWNEPIVLCEGGFDYLAIKRNVIPLIGKYIPDELMKSIIKNDVKVIYMALDPDAIRDSLIHIETFVKSGIKVFLVNMKEKDPSKLGFKKFWECVNTATEINFLQILKMKMEKI